MADFSELDSYVSDLTKQASDPGLTDLDAYVNSVVAEGAGQSPFRVLPKRLRPFANIRPHELQYADVYLFDTVSAEQPWELDALKKARKQILAPPAQPDRLSISDLKSLDERGARKEAYESIYGTPKPYNPETDASIEHREQFAKDRAFLAVHQYERDTGQRMSDKARAAQLSYYREMAGLGNLREYQEGRTAALMETLRPEELSVWESGLRAAKRAPFEISKKIGGFYGIGEGLAESAGMDTLSDWFGTARENSRIYNQRRLLQKNVLASKAANKVWNPTSLDWWTNRGVTMAPQMVTAMYGGWGGAALSGMIDAGQEYEAIYEQTGDKQRAAQIATAYGIAVSLTERWGAKVLKTDRQFSSKFARAIWMALYRGGIEGSQELAALGAEYLGTGRMPENYWDRVLAASTSAMVSSGMTGMVRGLSYTGGMSGMKPKMPRGVSEADINGVKMDFKTPVAADLPESIREDPKQMRMQIHRRLQEAYGGDKERATQTQRQIAWELAGKAWYAKTDFDPMKMLDKPLGDEAAVRARAEELGLTYKGVQVDENENPSSYLIDDPTTKSAFVVKDADDVQNAAALKRQKFFPERTNPDKFELKFVEDTDQLAAIYDQAIQYKPIDLPKVDNAPEANASLEKLTRRLNDEGKMTDDEFHSILRATGVADATGKVKTKISASQARRLRRALLGQEDYGQTDVLLAGARAQNEGVDAVLSHLENVNVANRAKRHSKGKKGLGEKYHEALSMRHVYAKAQDATGLDFRRAYDRVIAARHEADYGKAAWMGDILLADRKAKKILRRRGEDAEKIRKAIESGDNKGLSASERNVADAIRKQFEAAKIEQKVRELYDYMMHGEDMPGVPKDILDYAQREFDERGFEALYDVAKQHDFGIRKNYYPRSRKKSAQKWSLFQDLTAYYDATHAANRINPALNALNSLVERATGLEVPWQGFRAGDIMSSHTKRRYDVPVMENKDFADPERFVKVAASFNQALRSADPSMGLYGEAMNWLVSRGLTTAYAKGKLTVRNFLQTIAQDNNLQSVDNLIALAKSWVGHRSPEDVSFSERFNRQDRGLVQHMMMSQSELPVMRTVDKGAQYVGQSFMYADHANRNTSFTLSLAQTRRAMNEAGPDWKNTEAGIYKVLGESGLAARMDQATMKRAVEELALRGEDAFAHYIALQQSLDVNGAYYLAEQSPAAIDAGKVARRLGTFPRIVAEQWWRAGHTLCSPKSTSAQRDAAAIVLCKLMLGNWAANNFLNMLFGYEADSYVPWETLQFVPGGVAADQVVRIIQICNSVASAAQEEGWVPLWVAAGEGAHALGKRMVPFEATVEQAAEAAGLKPVHYGGKYYPVDESVPLKDRLQHVLTGRRMRTLVQQQIKKAKRASRSSRESRGTRQPVTRVMGE